MGERAVRKHDFTHDEDAVLAGAVWIEGYGLEHAVGVAAFSLLGGGTVEAPLRKLLEVGNSSNSFIMHFVRRFWTGV